MRNKILLPFFALFVLSLNACVHRIAVDTAPPGAAIKLKEVGGDKVVDLGESPVSTEVSATGEYVITATKTGYSVYKKKVDLGEDPKVRIELIPVYDIDFYSDPPGAFITLEDKDTGRSFQVGKTPVKYSVESKGPLVAIARLAGYKEVQTTLDTVPGQRFITQTFKMEK